MGYRVEEVSRFDWKSVVSEKSTSTGCGDAFKKQHLLKLWLPGRKNKILGKPKCFKVGKRSSKKRKETSGCFRIPKPLNSFDMQVRGRDDLLEFLSFFGDI